MTEEILPTHIKSKVYCEKLYPYYSVIRDKKSPVALPYSYYRRYNQMEEIRTSLSSTLEEFNNLYHSIMEEKQVVENPEKYAAYTVNLAKHRLGLLLERAQELNFIDSASPGSGPPP